MAPAYYPSSPSLRRAKLQIFRRSSSCQDCNNNFRAGESVVVNYKAPCGGNCHETFMANLRGCLLYRRPETGGCSNVTFTRKSTTFRIFSASPSSVDLQAPPAAFTIAGEAIDSTYGMPMIQFWSSNETLLAETPASGVAADGTWLTVNTPDLSGAYSGTFNVEVVNYNADGSQEIIGSAPMDAYGRDQPPPEPTPTPCPPCQPYMDCFPCDGGVS